jgi:hypothetical protein
VQAKQKEVTQYGQDIKDQVRHLTDEINRVLQEKMGRINNCFKNLDSLQSMLGMAYEESVRAALERAA